MNINKINDYRDKIFNKCKNFYLTDYDGKKLYYLSGKGKRLLNIIPIKYNSYMYCNELNELRNKDTGNYIEFDNEIDFYNYVKKNKIEIYGIWVVCIDLLIRYFDMKPSEAIKFQKDLERDKLYEIIKNKHKEMFF